MKLIKNYFIAFQCAILFIFSSVPTFILAQEARFTVVLDAGHGGHDPGAMGAFSREKDINLAIELKLGTLIEQNFKDVKVVYTRKTDKYLTLQERADVVNDHHADLFICVHTNSSLSPAAFGTETFTLGLAKTKANLDVAMRENSVILLEEDYRSKYKGFDPKSVDSYIMFEFMQDKYIDKSVEFSSAVQKQFVSSGRTNHGVRQAGFWVLHRSACPSVLVEVGFISNPAEERFLMSDQGQKQMATAIYNAFVDYKKSHDKRSGHRISTAAKIESAVPADESAQDKASIQSEDNQKPVAKDIVRRQKMADASKLPDDTSKTTKILTPVAMQRGNGANAKLVFKVQIFAARVELSKNAQDFKGLENVHFFVENRHYKYTFGEETNFSKIQQIRRSILSKFPDAFIIAFDGDRKLSPKEVQELSR